MSEPTKEQRARTWMASAGATNPSDVLLAIVMGHAEAETAPLHEKIASLEKQLEQKASGTCGLCLAAINGLPEGVAWSISGGGHDKRSVEIVTPDGDVVAEVFGSPAHLETAQQRAEAICAARRAAPEKQLELSEEGGARSRGEVAAAFFDTIKHALVCLDAPKTGMHVPYQGDFASAVPSVQQTLRWWLREWESAPSDPEKQPSPAAAPAQLSERDALLLILPLAFKEVKGESERWVYCRVCAYASAFDAPVLARAHNETCYVARVAALAGQPAPTAPLHLARIPFRPLCGADLPNQHTTDSPALANCLTCLRGAALPPSSWEAEIEPTEDREALRAAALDAMQERIGRWVRLAFHEGALTDRWERAARVVEEAIELAQAEGLSDNDVYAILKRAYDRPAGNREQEAGGIMVCLLAWAAGRETSLAACALREIERIEQPTTIEKIRRKQAEKAAAGTGHSFAALAGSPAQLGKKGGG